MPIDSEFLKILACPECKTPLRHRAKDDALTCDSCRRAYPIRNGIPILLVDEATVEN